MRAACAAAAARRAAASAAARAAGSDSLTSSLGAEGGGGGVDPHMQTVDRNSCPALAPLAPPRPSTRPPVHACMHTPAAVHKAKVQQLPPLLISDVLGLRRNDRGMHQCSGMQASRPASPPRTPAPAPAAHLALAPRRRQQQQRLACRLEAQQLFEQLLQASHGERDCMACRG